jgi:hypothetical protein
LKRNAAIATVNQYLLNASQLVSDAKDKLAMDSQQSLSLLTQATAAINQAADPGLRESAQPKQIRDFNSLKNEISAFHQSIMNGQNRYDQTVKNVNEVQEKCRLHVDQDLSQSHLWLCQALKDVVDLRSQTDVYRFLEEGQKKKLGEIEDMVGNQLLKISLQMISTSRSRALEAKSNEIIPFKEADILTHQVQQASSNKAYLEAATLAVKAADLFAKSIVLTPYVNQLDKIRNRFNKRTGKIDIHLLEKYSPQPFVTILKERQSAEDAIKIYDYPAAITHYDAALKALEMAIDHTTSSMATDGASTPLQLQVISDLKNQINNQYYDARIKADITRFFSDRLKK